MKVVKSLILVTLCSFFIMGSIPVDARTVEENETIEEGGIYVTDEIDPEVTVEVDEGDLSLWSVNKYINWSIGNNTEKRSSSFHLSKGKKVKFALNFSKTSRVTVGIVDGNGHSIYRNASGSYAKTVTADRTGTYRMFVKNKSGSKITVSGNYTR